MKNQQERQNNLSILSRSCYDMIKTLWEQLNIDPEFQSLKSPQVGMVMVKAQAGGSGQIFNMGEMTVTRSVIQLSSGETGYGYTQGRHEKKSQLIAIIDACYQHSPFKEKILENIIRPLSETLNAEKKSNQDNIQTSRVDFFTMIRGE